MSVYRITFYDPYKYFTISLINSKEDFIYNKMKLLPFLFLITIAIQEEHRKGGTA